MDDPSLFGRWFTGDSWNTWRAVLKAAYALPMSAADRATFRAVAGDRQPPARRVKAVGRRRAALGEGQRRLACCRARRGDRRRLLDAAPRRARCRRVPGREP